MNDASFIWEISEYRKVIWQQAFNSLNPTSNKISGQNAKIHFLNSQLSTNVLSKIWELSDMDKDGSLTLSEFYCACLLIDSCSKGYALPKQLPLELIGLVRATIDHVAQPVAPNYDILSNFFRDNSVQAPTKSHSCSDLVATTSPTNSLSRHEEYIKFFNSLKSFSEDKISGEMAKSVFTRTGLSLQTLAAVWRNSDQDEDGFLSQNEFISAMSQIDSLLAPAFFNPLKLGSSTQLKQVVDQQTNESRNVEDPNKLITHKLNKTLDMIVKDINSANNVLATLKINEKKLLKQKEKVSIDIASLEANHKHTLNSIDEMNKCFQNLKLNPISHPLMPESNAQNQRCNRQSLLEDPCIVPTLTKSYSQDISHLFEVPQQDTITSKYNSSDKFLNNFNDMHIFVPDKQYKNSDNFLSNNGRKSSNITEGLEENVSMKILISPELNRYGGSYTKPIAIAPPPKNPNKGHRISKRPSTSFSNRSGTSSGSKSIEGESQKSSDKSKIGNNKPQSSNSQKIINLFDPHSNQKQFDNNISIQNDRNIQPNSKLNLFGPFCSISPNHSHAIDNFGDISVKNNKKPNPSFKSINASPFLPPQNNIKNPKSVSSEITQSNADTQTDKSVHNIEQIRERACHTKKPKNILKKLFGVSSKCKTKTTKDIPVYSFTNTSHDKPKVPSRPKNETSFFPVSDNNKGQLQTLITTLQNNKLNNSDKNRDFYTTTEKPTIYDPIEYSYTPKNDKINVQSTFLNKHENYFELTEPIPIQFNTPQTSFKPQASPLLYNEREEKNYVSANTISEASVDEIDATYEPPLDMIAVKNFESTETPFAFKTKDKLLVMFKSQNFYYAEIGEHGDWFPCNSVTLYSNLNDATIFENQYTVNGFRVGLYNNEIEEHDDIPFAKDDILIELEDLGEWIRGYSNGKIGLYPKNYTETLTCLNVIEVATATQDYTSTNDCELTISRGKKIAVLNKNSTGWSVVVEENSADIGFIPTQCIV